MALIKCSECGKEISDKAKICINCGAPIDISIQSKETPSQSKPDDLNQHKGTEANYYSLDGVKITNTRFIVENTTYSVNGITSVRTSIISPNKTGPIFAIVFGAILALLGYNSSSNITTIGIILAIIGIVWLLSLKTWYDLRISTAAGETDAVTSKDEDYIRKIATALNQAIIYRG
ncbi:MAG TPA: DUF6232 family protein [Bacteroidia bacterium]|jgi:hypothetical protein|nr:DUF6232 family protein [Bacteroidia bacterium]